VKRLRIICEACEHVSDHAIQAAVKRAHSVDAEGNPRLGNPPYDLRLDTWGNSLLSQELTTYESFPYNVSDEDSEPESDEFW